LVKSTHCPSAIISRHARWGVAIVDEKNANVLSFIRTAHTGAKHVLVVMNLTANAQTANIQLQDAGLKSSVPQTLLASPGFQTPTSLGSMSVPPYSVWIATIRELPKIK
jgi:hypothetical protein